MVQNRKKVKVNERKLRKRTSRESEKKFSFC